MNRIVTRNVLALALLSVALVFLIVPTGVQAGVNRKNWNRKPVHSKASKPEKVLAVDLTANTITVTEGGGSKAYSVDKFTAITINGKDGKLSDVKRGMEVSVSSSSGDKATQLDVTGVPDESTKPNKKKK